MAVNFDPYDLLKSIVTASTSSLSSEAKLDRMLRILSEGFGSERSLFLRPEKLGENGFFSRVASEKKPLWVEEESSSTIGEVLPEEKELVLPSFACIPLGEDDSFLGILYIGFSMPHRFSPRETELLLLAAKEMEGAIRSDLLHLKTEQTLSESAALYEIGKAATSTLKLETLLQSIMETGLKTLTAKGGVLRVENRKTKALEVMFSVGVYHEDPLDERIAQRVFHSQTPLHLNHQGEGKAPLSVLSVPFLAKGKSFGTLTFYDKKTNPSTFDNRDFQLLLTLANQMACAVENARVHYETSEMAKEHEKRLNQLSILWELSKALLTTVNFERIVQVMLTAITVGDGLKFNRAMLFMVNEKEGVLEGTMAVGPESAEDAGRIWSALSRRKGLLSDLISQISPPQNSTSTLNATVKGIQIPLEQEGCILSRTVLEGRTFNTDSPDSPDGWLRIHCGKGCPIGSEVACDVGEYNQNPKTYSYATVPLWGKGKVIGVILVDNLYNHKPIREEDIQFLTMFTNQAGLAIENSILYRNLEEVHRELRETQAFLVQHEKMAALGALTTNIAHEIRNPLVSIGGFARRLDRNTLDEPHKKKYTETIMKEVSRLEKIIDDVEHYTRGEAPVFKEWDPRAVLEESLSIAERGADKKEIELVKAFPEEIPKIKGDYHQLTQAFSNLISNAYQAMNGKGTLSVRIQSISKNKASFVRIEIEDTGSGIDPENLQNIFNPFYSTKEARLGLGLPIVHKIITSHQGQIEVHNRPGEGTAFIVVLPAAK